MAVAVETVSEVLIRAERGLFDVEVLVAEPVGQLSEVVAHAVTKGIEASARGQRRHTVTSTDSLRRLRMSWGVGRAAGPTPHDA
ncbi:hypothetical protein ACHBTE_03930 [Streptomyces sp. M41]|uniref:hypothetical protein n=1 Tax=Streptomyces sp. M41 TaxID=3059412 RepID=UPI00374D864F